MSSPASAPGQKSSSPATQHAQKKAAFDKLARAAVPLTGDALKAALKKQVEFYFSKENLSRDAHLVSQMNSDMQVSIEVIAQFHKVRALTQDLSLIADAVKDSKVVTLDATGKLLKPTFSKAQRNTVILRDVPTDAGAAEVKAIFSKHGKVISARSDVGNTWFVTMESEAVAKETLLQLRLSGAKLGGKPIKARLKSENLLRSVYPANQGAAGAANAENGGGARSARSPQGGALGGKGRGRAGAQNGAPGAAGFPPAARGGPGYGAYGMAHPMYPNMYPNPMYGNIYGNPAAMGAMMAHYGRQGMFMPGQAFLGAAGPGAAGRGGRKGAPGVAGRFPPQMMYMQHPMHPFGVRPTKAQMQAQMQQRQGGGKGKGGKPGQGPGGAHGQKGNKGKKSQTSSQHKVNHAVEAHPRNPDGSAMTKAQRKKWKKQQKKLREQQEAAAARAKAKAAKANAAAEAAATAATAATAAAAAPASEQGATEAPSAPAVDDADLFPSLPGAPSAGGAAPGYRGKFQRYGHKDVLDIVRKMPLSEITPPKTFADRGLKRQCDNAVLDKPIPEYLERQRTLSMDEVNEAVLRGKPIRVDRAQSIDTFGDRAARKAEAHGSDARASAPIDNNSQNTSPNSPPKQAAQGDAKTKDQKVTGRWSGYAAALLKNAAPTEKAVSLPKRGKKKKPAAKPSTATKPPTAKPSVKPVAPEAAPARTEAAASAEAATNATDASAQVKAPAPATVPPPAPAPAKPRARRGWEKPDIAPVRPVRRQTDVKPQDDAATPAKGQATAADSKTSERPAAATATTAPSDTAAKTSAATAAAAPATSKAPADESVASASSTAQKPKKVLAWGTKASFATMLQKEQTPEQKERAAARLRELAARKNAKKTPPVSPNQPRDEVEGRDVPRATTRR